MHHKGRNCGIKRAPMGVKKLRPLMRAPNKGKPSPSNNFPALQHYFQTQYSVTKLHKIVVFGLPIVESLCVWLLSSNAMANWQEELPR